MVNIEGYQLPSTFRFPTERDFAAYTTGALSHLGFDSEITRGLTLPMQTQVNTLITAFESTAGAKIDQLATVLGSETGLTALLGGKEQSVMQVVGNVTSMVFNLVNGDVAMAVKSGVQLATAVAKQFAGSLGSIASIIPIVGAMISAVVDAIIMYDTGWSQEDKDRAQKRAEAEVHEYLREKCPTIATGAQPIATAAGGASPADLFRSVFIAAQLGHPLPPTLASMYVLLCGAETQGVGFTRREYDFFLNDARKKYGDVGIHPAIQRRMWALVKSIMFSARDPRLSAPLSVHGDHGRSTYALLQDIVRQQYNKGRWNEDYAAALSRVVGSQFEIVEYVNVGDYATSTIWTTCGAGDYMLLDKGLLRAQRLWNAALEENFCAPGTPPLGEPCRWKALPSAAAIAAVAAKSKRVGMKAVMTVGSVQIGQLIKSLNESEEREAAASEAARNLKILLAVGGVGVAGAAIVGASRMWGAR